MRYSQLTGKTDTARAISGRRWTSRTLLEQGGFVRSFGGGLHAYLAPGIRVLKKISDIIRDELEALGGQEVEAPFVLPLSLWEKTGRHEIVADELVHLQDRTGRKLLLASSHLEGMTELMRLSVHSAEDLPAFLFQFQKKFRDEKIAQEGIIRAKEFLMSDAYSFHRSYTDLNSFFPKVFAAYEKIFSRCGIDCITAESAVGSISGDKAYEFLMPTQNGDELIVTCPGCGYIANREVGLCIKDYSFGPPVPLKEFVTSADYSLSRFMEEDGITKSQVIVSKIYRVYGGFVMACCIHGYEVSTEKLSRYLNTAVIREANREEYKSFDVPPDYAGPIGVDDRIKIVVDDAVAGSENLLAGANRKNTYLANINFGRDFETHLVSDIVRSKPGNRCKLCGTVLEPVRALELGNIFKLGDFFPRSLGFSLEDDSHRPFYPNMGSYGIGMGRLMAAVVESHHDDRGIDWPVNLAPYTFYLTGAGKSPRIGTILQKLYSEFSADSLYNDRPPASDARFDVADTMGIPYRVLVSTESLERNSVRISRRSGKGTRSVSIDDAPGEMAALLSI